MVEARAVGQPQRYQDMRHIRQRYLYRLRKAAPELVKRREWQRQFQWLRLNDKVKTHACTEDLWRVYARWWMATDEGSGDDD